MRADGLPPGPPQGRLRQVIEWTWRPVQMLEKSHRRYGDAFTLRMAGLPPIVILADPAAVREVFTGDSDKLLSGKANRFLEAALGRHSLLVLDGREHLRERKLMLPPFHGERMRAYAEVIDTIAEREVASWPTDEPFRVAPAMRSIALEVILRAVFGVDDAGRNAPLRRALERMLEGTTPPWRFLGLLLAQSLAPSVRGWRRASPLMRRVDKLLFAEIARRRREPGGAGRDDILSLLIEARDDRGEPLSDEHLRDELMTMLVAGHETTATALAWGLERLARTPAALDRLEAEVDAGEDAYLDATAAEILRARPVVPFALRELTEPMTIGGFDLPAGVRAAPCGWLVHQRPDIYPDPDEFRPERFLDAPPGTYTWIPFGGGTRRCLGGSFSMFEMKHVLRAVVSARRVTAVGGEDEGYARRGVTFVPAGDTPVLLPARVPEASRPLDAFSRPGRSDPKSLARK
jgi:cytochrome P450